MITIINKRKNGSLFHYAHFICDLLYPEVINEIYKYEKVIRIKNINQTLGNFSKIYEDVMKNKSLEIDETEFNSLNIQPIILLPKEQYTDIEYINIFRNYIFNRYNMNENMGQNKYPEILLINRGDRIQLIDDPELQKINKNVSTGKERREISDINKIEKYLKNNYSLDRFQSIYL